MIELGKKIIQESEDWGDRTNTHWIKDNIDKEFDTLYNEKSTYNNLDAIIEDLESIYGKIDGISDIYDLYYNDASINEMKQAEDEK